MRMDRVSDFRFHDREIAADEESEIYNRNLIVPVPALREQSRQSGLDDFLLRGLRSYFTRRCSTTLFSMSINAIGRAPIAVPRLPTLPTLMKYFFVGLDRKLIDLHSFYAVIAHECPGDMGVTEKTNRGVLIGETRDGIEIVEDVAPLARRIESRMDDREIAHLPLSDEDRGATPCLLPSVLARPFDGRLRQRIEIARGFCQRRLLVVISFHHRAIQSAHDLDAFVRVRVVTNDVAEADEMCAAIRSASARTASALRDWRECR